MKKILEEYSVKMYNWFLLLWASQRKHKRWQRWALIYFTEYSLTAEIDEQIHEGKELLFEEKRQEALEKKAWL